MTPEVSLIIPTMGERASLAVALRTALAQDFPRLEILVVDDAQPGATWTQVEPYATLLADPRVRVVPFGRRVTFGLNGNGQDNRGLEEGSPEVNRVITGVASLDWRFTNWGRALGTYSRVWQDSEVATLSDLDYDRFTVGIALTLYSTGEPPIEPGKEGEPRDDDPDVP